MVSPLRSVKKLCDLIKVPPPVLTALANDASNLYRPFQLKKIGRKIDNPREFLKAVQERIDRRLLRAIPLPGFVNGGVPGRCVRDNAIEHVGKDLVVRLDVRKYFPSIRTDHVARSLREHLKVGRDVEWILTRLLTVDGHLPQGAPSSSTMANVVLAPIVASAIGRLDIKVTVWIDDITVSGPDAREAIEALATALSRNGLPISRGKTKIMPQHRQQVVTGVTVNRKPSIGKKRKREIRNAVRANKGRPIDARLRGRLAHASSVSPSQAGTIARSGGMPGLGRSVPPRAPAAAPNHVGQRKPELSVTPALAVQSPLPRGDT